MSLLVNSPASPFVRSAGSQSASRRRGLVAAVVAGVVAVGSLVPQSATAARSSSSTIATQSSAALASLRTWQSTGDDNDLVAYELLRNRVATTIAGAVGVDPAGLRVQWAEVDLVNQEAMLAAGTQIGVPYRRYEAVEGVGFDCSGITMYAYGQAGVELPRVSSDQIRHGDRVEADDAQPGDLVYYPGHIMMLIGDGVILHSPQTGRSVEVAHLTKKSVRYADVTPDGTDAVDN